jgi:hypothetical protein
VGTASFHYWARCTNSFGSIFAIATARTALAIGMEKHLTWKLAA